MKLICKKTGPTKDRLSLTIDKEYEVIKTRYDRFDNSKVQSYRVVNDDGVFSSTQFCCPVIKQRC